MRYFALQEDYDLQPRIVRYHLGLVNLLGLKMLSLTVTLARIAQQCISSESRGWFPFRTSANAQARLRCTRE
jgi:hypothetical protein